MATSTEVPWEKECGGENGETSRVLSFWLGTAPRLILCCVGLAANGVVILVFSDANLGASAFNRLLALLAYIDGSYLFFCFLEDLIVAAHAATVASVAGERPGGVLWIMLYPYLLHPVQQLFLTASCVMTMAISVNRYMAIVHPLTSLPSKFGNGGSSTFDKVCQKEAAHLDGRRLRRRQLQLRFSASHAIGLAAIFVSALYCLPHFLEYEVTWPGPELKTTDLRDSKVFSVGYTSLADAVLRTLIPAAVMIYTGWRVWRATVAAGASACRPVALPARPILLANAGLVCLFVASHSLKLFYNIYIFTVPGHKCLRDVWLVAVYEVAKLLLVAGCSMNLLVYVAVGERFRRTLYAMLGLHRR